MIQNLDDIALFLNKVGMKAENIPIYSEYKKRDRERTYLHPKNTNYEINTLFKRYRSSNRLDDQVGVQFRTSNLKIAKGLVWFSPENPRVIFHFCFAKNTEGYGWKY